MLTVGSKYSMRDLTFEAISFCASSFDERKIRWENCN